MSNDATVPAPAPTGGGKIKNYSDELFTELKALTNDGDSLPFDLSYFPRFIKIDVTSTTTGLGRLKQNIPCDRIVAVFGIDAITDPAKHHSSSK